MTKEGFISYYPLKQGLKLSLIKILSRADRRIYILLSIKTRIETHKNRAHNNNHIKFISYYPLKQGLKPFPKHIVSPVLRIYILLSIKTRIETR